MSRSSLPPGPVGHAEKGPSSIKSQHGGRRLTRLLGALLLGVLIAAANATAAYSPSSRLCLRPLFSDRPRLQDVDKTGVLWLNLLLRQHEVCWRKPRSPNETRIFALGNSAMYGFPWPSELSAVGLVNRMFDRQNIPAHLFNLGFVFTYQVKEALILSEALPYEPDFVVYGATLDDFGHLAPFPYLPVTTFFNANSRAVAQLASDPPPTFGEPFRKYRDAQAENIRPYASWIAFRQTGTFVRLAVEQTAKMLRRKLFPAFREANPQTHKRRALYNCAEVKKSFSKKYANWKEWNMLEYLAILRRETGMKVLVVNWPVAYEPRGDCYNVRYPTAALEDYVDWMGETTKRLGLEYLDLHDLLARQDFVDSVHPTVGGQKKVAIRLAKQIATLLHKETISDD